MKPSNLKAARKRLGLTQAQLAKKLCMSRESVHSMEIGRRPIHPRTQRLLRAILAEKPDCSDHVPTS